MKAIYIITIENAALSILNEPGQGLEKKRPDWNNEK
jgi:hypothetical protein